ncbi:MAG: right-handed parallel beta-helix repeat-containing protein [Candidatus Eisenbacteria bacterium]|uniref:Right-handed parallel beta-helix repeat-containing protein n=1 Tax=Eiseniibacteriota bacterium TaxID=2212470 RepID=A0A7Y2EB11_UNCEI|nr:right-handed parallel beta-helix repeat-containing protein [Candidatus Eisenbacteria bacterium]
MRLYRDGGDMNPNGGDDLLVQTVTTTATGSFSATGLVAGNYWVTVDSRDLSPSAGFASGGQGDVWAEQTYGPRGSYCADDGGLRGASTLPTADYCFAGRTATGSDNANNLASAEHLTSIALVDSVVNLNFGFSFNVVTNTEDDDDDGANRTQQGGFRQFIQNANALSGGNTMRFVPVEATNASGSGGNWWNIALTSSLPSLQNPGTEIDGFAYRYDNLSPRNSNGGVTGNSGAPVGTGPDGVVGTGDEVLLPNYERPELEINGTDRNPVFDFVGSNQRVSNLGVYNAGATAFYVGGGTGQVISNNLIGPRADGSDPGGGLRVGQAIRTYNSEVSILQNRVAYLELTGIFVLDAALIEENDLFDVARSNAVGDGITMENTNSQTISVLGNRVEQVAAYGIESWQAQGPFTIRDNTVIRSGRQGGQGETGGIRVFGNGSTVTQNLVTQAVGAGIVIPRLSNGTVSQGNLVSRNSLFDNGGLGLDLDQTTLSGNPNGDGVSPNDGVTVAGQQNIGLDYPVFTLATYFNGDLHLEGYVGTQSSPLSGTFTIELFIAEDDGNNNGEVEAGDGQNEPHGEPKTYFHTFTTAPDGTFVQDFAAPAWVGLPTGQLIAASARDALNNTSEFSSLRVIVLGAPDITILKTSQAIYDPVNESTNPKSIPGATVLYALNLINDGFGATDSSTVTIIDPLPSEVALVVEDIAGVGSGPVAFMDGFVSSGLNFSFTNFADTTDSVDFSNDGGFTFGYAPSAGPDGTDPAVTHLRIRPEGVFQKSNGVSDPEFEVRFQVKVR